jgi:hypothetical protein
MPFPSQVQPGQFPRDCDCQAPIYGFRLSPLEHVLKCARRGLLSHVNDFCASICAPGKWDKRCMNTSGNLCKYWNFACSLVSLTCRGQRMTTPLIYMHDVCAASCAPGIKREPIAVSLLLILKGSNFPVLKMYPTKSRSTCRYLPCFHLRSCGTMDSVLPFALLCKNGFRASICAPV